MKIFTRSFIFFLTLFPAITYSQSSGILSAINFSGYADAYIAYYTDSLGTGAYQKFTTVSPRSEQFGLNIAQLSAKYSADRVRAAITLQYGDIPLSSWSGTFNFIQEANAGIRVTKNFWIDAGFFRTHIGTEGLLPKENITSSIAVPTFYEPYNSSIKLITPTEKLALNLYLLNGYNLFEDNNRKKSIGVLGTYVINDHLTIGYDNYIGDDTPSGDTVHHLRFYNNAFVNYEKNKVKIVTGIDFCLQGDSKFNQTSAMVSGLFTVRYTVTKMFDVYGRWEGFFDHDGILSGIVLVDGIPANNEGLQLWGITFGAEFKPTENSYVRLEGRDLVAQSSQEIFYWDGENQRHRFEGMLHLGVWFP